MDRYVVIDSSGYIANVILWDGVSPLSLGDGLRLELESETAAEYPPVENGDQ